MSFTVCTALIRRDDHPFCGTLAQRVALLRALLTQLQPTEVLLLPGGFFGFDQEPAKAYQWVETHIPSLVQRHAPQTVVAMGLDCTVEEKRHELAVAVSKSRIKAVGRKFHDDFVEQAEGPWEREHRWRRTFTKKGRTYYLAVCYDSFGLRQGNVPRQEPVDAVLNAVHYFHPAGEAHGGDVYFARHGLAGAARQWKRPVFGAAHFLRPEIPPHWPAGVKWKRGLAPDHHWRYADNTLQPVLVEEVKRGRETVELRYFQL